ncbi:hypothetical protein WG68_08180 [Arsukibacterium ikkense]|uniref:Uncharacterized protein n=1 Tax=Arsukibacterium ikkense TaxID=336831 RepID=A0A0M2V5Q1_9GAMM|nr:hypothetical protein [Arsukibacterium ikkense]KKO45971.1 hypothetical protein WG68_08180 [Arsukibacterium ikkense]
MLWPLIKDSVPLKAIILLVLMLLLWWFNWYTAGTVLLLLIADIVVSFSLTPANKGEFVFSKDIQRLFSIDGSWLQVAMDRARISDIKQLNLYQKDQLAYVDFKLNQNMQVRYKFPLQQYQPLLQWLQQHLPQTQIITGFKS